MDPAHAARYLSGVSHMTKPDVVPARGALQKHGTVVQAVSMFLPWLWLLGPRGCPPVPWATCLDLHRKPHIKPA